MRQLSQNRYRQTMVQEVDEQLYQVGTLACSLPMNLPPLIRESLKANLATLVEALEIRGIDIKITLNERKLEA